MNIKTKQFFLILVILLLFVIIDIIVYYSGGTKYVFPYLMLIPIIISAIFYYTFGGAINGFFAGIFLAFLPLDTTLQIKQSPLNYILRIFLLTLLGGFIGYLLKKKQNITKSVGFETNIYNEKELLKEKVNKLLKSNKNFSLILIDVNNIVEITSLLNNSISDFSLNFSKYLKHKYKKKIEIFINNDFSLLLLLKNYSLNETENWIINFLDYINNNPFIINNMSLFLKTFLVGIHQNYINNFDDGFKKIVTCLYYAKENNLDYFIYNDTVNFPIYFTSELLVDIHNAIKKNELFIVYQPKLNLADNKVKSVEALIRWKHSTKGFIPPNKFIPQVEKTTYINNLTLWIIKKVINDLNNLKKKNINIKISINISPRNLMSKLFLIKLMDILNSNKNIIKNLEFELTERDIITELSSIKKILLKLQKMNLTIAMDDFGTGYSSLANLKYLPIDIIKIDKEFIKNLDNNIIDYEMVKSTIKISKLMNKKIVAEGVENKDTLEILSKLYCFEAQGYYISKPITIDELTKFILNYNKKAIS
ncbi:EAL domain-containing protein (putative c-di-GMP-specific phosphodiesterase class I) [Hypnocyclicus thermotrophus]|uniref:EAL domain-containing protein (Putative c-di-GMP-specific phosphodiesterase class I) n=1 Tax=Hypnocyclicus thermotrophus TaxID=1627895 RepID=A0AA46DZY4_9FUSO|nr:EAL domain-containing protein [Hypnocyclicus thermotrophus]TDT71776.1 EAL domain-containing protein (putative c-di-GMP-specific phosphodiesterase class I) [Hypnocyclicus thermotrophus]